mmetsp:Transcript_2818/g.8088  ORF Transcript_2818/g.8088 Transcript_2818/m.8088 type:complete len:268 (-) Transcript_2818:19-822(-)
MHALATHADGFCILPSLHELLSFWRMSCCTAPGKDCNKDIACWSSSQPPGVICPRTGAVCMGMPPKPAPKPTAEPPLAEAPPEAPACMAAFTTHADGFLTSSVCANLLRISCCVAAGSFDKIVMAPSSNSTCPWPMLTTCRWPDCCCCCCMRGPAVLWPEAPAAMQAFTIQPDGFLTPSCRVNLPTRSCWTSRGKDCSKEQAPASNTIGWFPLPSRSISATVGSNAAEEALVAAPATYAPPKVWVMPAAPACIAALETQADGFLTSG